MNLKPFDLQRALAGDPVVTRAGSIVKELHYFETIPYQKLCCVVNGCILTFTDDGHYYRDGKDDDHDLFMLPQKKTYWVNIYRCDIANNNVYVRGLFDTEEEAIKLSGMDLLKTISFEVEV